MVTSAPRIDARLRRLARRLARRRMPVADIHRSVGVYSQRLGLPRPSYEQVRITVNQHRLRLAERRATAKLLLEIDLNTRPATDILLLLDGHQPPRCDA